MDVVLTPLHVADRLGISVRTLERLRMQGTGPRYTKVGRQVRYPEHALVEYLKDGERASTSET